MLVTLRNGFLSSSEASSEFPFLDVSNHLIRAYDASNWRNDETGPLDPLGLRHSKYAKACMFVHNLFYSHLLTTMWHYMKNQTLYGLLTW